MRKILTVLIICGAAWAARPAGTTPEAAAPAPPPAPAAATTPAAGEGIPADVVTAAGGGENADVGAVTLLSSSESGCAFEVRVPPLSSREAEGGGRRWARVSLPFYTLDGREGEPEMLVRYVNVAAPPGADVTVAVDRVSYDVKTGVALYPRPRNEARERRGEQTLEEAFTFDAKAYAGGVYPAAFAALAGQDTVRGYRLLRVAVHPYQYEPARELLKAATSVVVRVSFVGGVRRPNAQYPERPAEEGIFSRIIPATVLNWEVAQKWPFYGRPQPALNGAIWPTSFADKPAMKVIIADEHLYRVTYSDLNAAGFPVDAVTPADLRLYVGTSKSMPRTFTYEHPGLTELPIYVAGQGDGRFDPGDYVEFYGHGCDFFEPATAGHDGTLQFSKDKFTRYNVYWLVADDKPGKRTTAADAKPSGGMKPPYFWDRVHLEQDFNEDFALWYTVDEGDELWYWRQLNGGAGSANLSSFNVTDLAPSGPEPYFRMMVRAPAMAYNNGPFHTRLYLNAAGGDQNKFLDEVYDSMDEVVFQKRVPAGLLEDETNRLYFEEVGDLVSGSGLDVVLVDYFEFEYPRQYRARQDYLAFANPPDKTGQLLFEIRGFTSNDVVVYDLTRGRRLTGVELKAEGGSYTVRFSDNIPTGVNRYVAATAAAAAAKKPVDLYIDAGSRLRALDEDYDEIVVVYDGYNDNIQPLVNFRRAQGRSVAVARVTDVYDEYAGGLFEPLAIRSFVADLYGKAASRPGGRLPDALLVVGDACTDWRDTKGRYANQALWRNFGLNQVPTYYVVGWSNSRTASDNFFVAMSDSRWPDMAVGRLAAPFDENIDNIVDKLLDYERRPTNGPWTARVLMSADNDGIAEDDKGGDFVWDDEQVETDLAPFGYEVRKENIEWLNRRFRGNDWNGFDLKNRGMREADVATYMKPNFLRSYDSLFLSYAGHGGPQAWSHENIYADHKFPMSGGPPLYDSEKLENGPCYPIISQLSCSTAYFDYYLDENFDNDYTRPDDDQSISEYTLQAPRNGAVAVLGSTRLGTEPAQADFLEEIYAYLFPGRKPRAEGVTIGEVHYAAKLNAGTTEVRDEQVLLGDPAMTVATPRPGVKLTPDKTTVRRGELLKVAGTVPGNFNGRATVQLFDRPWYYHSRSLDKELYRDRLCAATEVEVANGRFTATLVVPTVPVSPVPSMLAGSRLKAAAAKAGDAVAAGPAAAEAAAGKAASPAAAVSGGPAAVTPYVDESYEPIAEDGRAYLKAVAYGTGFRQSYMCDEVVTLDVQGEVSSNDKEGPQVGVYLDDYSFRSGDPSGPTPNLIVEVRDPSGVLRARDVESIGEQEQTFVPLTAKIDNGVPIDLTFYYKPAYNDYRAGSAEKKLTGPQETLVPGSHTIKVSAYDSFGNRTDKAITCVVSGALGLGDVMNCPNPFADDTYFTFTAATNVDSVVIKVFTVTGRLVKKIQETGLPAGYNQIRWDGRDNAGDAIANGVYFYTITARAGDQKFVARQKLVKMR